jgi:hypothetical protein
LRITIAGIAEIEAEEVAEALAGVLLGPRRRQLA